jgi:hypothetical protein
LADGLVHCAHSSPRNCVWIVIIRDRCMV